MKLIKHNYIFSLLLLGLLLMSDSLLAQRITVRPIPLLDELPVKAIHRIFQDSDGYMWYGTFNGLCRYDGYDIDVFRSDMFTPNLLKDNYITYIAEDHEKKIWFGTLKGLYILDKATYEITSVEVDDIAERNIFTINVTSDGTIWVSVAGSLYRFNANGTLLRKYNMMFNQVGQCVYIVYEDKDGNLLISVTDSGMYKLNKTTDVFEPYFHNKDYRFIERIIWDDIHHCYWLGTWEKGIVRFNPEAMSVEQQYIPQPLPMDIAHQSTGDVFHMVQDDVFHYLWVTTDRNLFVFKITDEGSLEQVDTSSFLPAGNKMLYEIYKDREGELWVSAFDNESFIVDICKNVINKYPLSSLRNRINASPVIASLCKDSEGVFWFTQERYGLCTYNAETNVLKHYSECPNVRMLNLESVTNLTASKTKGTVWGVQYPFSLLVVKFHQENMEIQQDTCINLQRLVKHPDHVLSLLEDEKGNLWIGTNKGLFVYRLHSDKLEIVDKELGSVTGIVQANDGKIWFVVSNKGVGYMKTDREYEMMKISKDFTCMSVSSDGKLWLGTGMGEVLQFDTQKKELSNHSIDCGMNGDYVNDIVVDIYNHIWIVTNQMLKEYNPSNGAYRSYATNNPQLLLSRFTSKAYYDYKDGDIFLGGVSGIVSLSPSQGLESIPKQITTHITDVKMMGKSIRKDISSSNSIRLSPDIKDLEISFSSLNYHDLEQIRYAYRLKGVDKDWIYLNSGDNKAFYNQLDKGTYTFQVKATDRNGLWSNHITELEIYRAPAFYETWWAHLIYVCMSMGFISLFVFLYLRRMRIRNNRILAAKMTQLKLRYFTNVSHELLTPLTVLSCLADSIHSSDEEDKKHVFMMQVNIKRLKNLLQQILDLRKIDNKKMQLSVSYGDVLAFVKELYENSFSFVMSEKQIAFFFEANTDAIRGYFDRDKLDKIVSNLLSNAYKYTPSGKSITLSMETKMDQNHHECLVLKVKDEGLGISSKEQDKIFVRFYNNKYSKPGMSNGIGLSLTKELVELHHGHIGLESTLGKGSIFTIEIPLDKESYLPNELQEVSEPIIEDDDETTESSIEKNSQETLLLVEDNRELLYLMKGIFSEDYQVMVAGNGKDAWECIKTNNIDIVVSDVIMPEMDGIELCRHIKENILTSHIIVVLLTAQISIEKEITSYELGADDYVSKPFEPNILKARLRNLLKKKKLIQSDFKSNPSAGMISKIDFTSQDERLIEKAIEVVERHLSNPEFDVVALAGELGMSRSTLARKIKGISGRTPLDFIKDIKMKHACQMLKNKNMSIAEVVVALGYNDHKYFTASFKETWGMSPSEYQKREVETQSND